MKVSKNDQIGQIVAADMRTAAVFEQFGLDFCCGGNQSISDACSQKNISEIPVLQALEQINGSDETIIDFQSWPIDLLADYIEKKHHRFVNDRIPVIQSYLEKICAVHGRTHPELFEIQHLFSESAKDLLEHLKKEETILFPFVRAAVTGDIKPSNSNEVKDSINDMLLDHDHEGERFRKIAHLSNGYTVPEDACATYKAAYFTLNEFEKDLHRHIHLENNILFPKALQL